MPDLNAIDRLQPCLLDRLFDDQPRRLSEGKQEKVVSLARFKEGVKRDIEWLLNSKTRFDHLDATAFSEIRYSVLNYGVRDFTGLSSENLSAADIERSIHRALTAYEPRILRESLTVRHLAVAEDDADAEIKLINALDFEISGKVWADPTPQDFVVRTEINLEENTVTVT